LTAASQVLLEFYDTGGSGARPLRPGGNDIIVVPELDLTVVFLASNYNQAVMHETKYEYVPTYILKSVIDAERVAGG
jgi:hypothetical protein